MTNPLASPWIPLFVLGLLVMATRVRQRSWVAPSVFAPLVWFCYVLLPLAVAPEYRVSALAVWLVVLLMACTVFGAILGQGRAKNDSVAPSAAPSSISVRLLLRWTLLLSVLSLAGALYSAVQAIKDYGLDLSPSGLMSVGHFLAVERYAGEQTPTAVRLLVIWMYPAALLGGVSYALARSRKERILCFSPLLPALTFSLVQAAKANTLISVSLALSGYLAARVMLGADNFRPVSKNAILVLISAIVSSVSLFLVVDIFRSHTETRQAETEISVDWGRIKSATIGYLGVFSDWVDRPDGPGSLQISLGEYTLGGLYEVVGLHPRQTGVYEDLVTLDQDNNDSNIYTAFRGLIEDFSLPGAVALCGLVGYVSGFAYRMNVFGNTWPVLVLAAFYSFMIWSPIGSVFVYNGPILAFVVGAFVLKKVMTLAHLEFPVIRA